MHYAEDTRLSDTVEMGNVLKINRKSILMQPLTYLGIYTQEPGNNEHGLIFTVSEFNDCNFIVMLSDDVTLKLGHVTYMKHGHRKYYLMKVKMNNTDLILYIPYAVYNRAKNRYMKNKQWLPKKSWLRDALD